VLGLPGQATTVETDEDGPISATKYSPITIISGIIRHYADIVKIDNEVVDHGDF